MNLYSTDGVMYVPHRPSTNNVPLPPNTYTVGHNPKTGFFLTLVENLPVPKRIYGVNHAPRILSMYNHRVKENISTGVWLNGCKGSGKTMLAACLSQELRAQGIPTILVQNAMFGPDFNSFVEHVGQACFIFDEFEKVYRVPEDADNGNPQEAMLTLFGGAVVACNMYIITTNSSASVSDAMNNRPTRMRYFIDYAGVSADVVQEYVHAHLKDASVADQLVRLLSHVASCNFDILQCVVEEHNVLGGDIENLMSIMNVHRRGSRMHTVRYSGPYFDPVSKKIVHINAVGKWNGDLFDEDFLDHIRVRLTITNPGVSGYPTFGPFYDLSTDCISRSVDGTITINAVPDGHAYKEHGTLVVVPELGFSSFRQQF